MKKRIFKIKTFGCKVNQYETQAIREALASGGYEEAKKSQKADLCIVNTCTVTAKADKECRDTLRRFIRENPDAEIIAAGCYSEKGKDAIRTIDEKITTITNSEKFAKWKNNTCGISYHKDHTKAFIKIQDGCDNFCSYCIVPHVRGRSKSRDLEKILEEARRLISNEYKELVLTGICLGDFGKDLGGDKSLVWLVKKITAIEGIFRIRLSSIELQDVTDELIYEIGTSNRLCNHLHIPLQSGDDSVLKSMNRKYTTREFIDRIGYIRSIIPGIAITTDVIVGYPGETDVCFQNTLKSIEEIRPSRTHIFTYSPREHTKAFSLNDTVSREIKKERFVLLKELTDKLAEEFQRSSKGSKERVLVENFKDMKKGLLSGYTDTYIKVAVEGSRELIGKLIVREI